jgi:hypothetical protein
MARTGRPETMDPPLAHGLDQEAAALTGAFIDDSAVPLTDDILKDIAVPLTDDFLKDIAAAIGEMGFDPVGASRLKPPARRAAQGANLALGDLPASFEEVERDYRSTARTPSGRPSSSTMADDLVDGFLAAAMGEGGADQYSWSPSADWPAHRRAAASQDNDIEDRLAFVQDTLTDLEANLGASLAATDSTVTETSVAVDSLTEDVQAFKETTAEGLAGVHAAVQVLTAQVGSLHSTLAEIKNLLLNFRGPPASA